MADVRTILKNTDIFSQLSEEEVNTITAYSNVKHFPAGTTVFSQGDSGTELYIIHNGEISISRLTKEKKDLELARFINGDLFGELDFFQNSRRNATARAEADSDLLQFPKEGFNFNDILEKHPLLSAELLHSFLTIIAGRIRTTNKLVSENSPVIRELRKKMYGDKLTGLFNRTYLEEQLQSFLENERPPVSLLMVKPDNFKYINDNYGHEAGDQTLRILAGMYKKLIKPKDGLVRFMGNEFGFVLTATGRREAVSFAKQLQKIISELDLSEVTDGDTGFKLTISTGISVYPEHGNRAEEIIHFAHELPLIGRARGGGKILFPEDKSEEGNSHAG